MAPHRLIFVFQLTVYNSSPCTEVLTCRQLSCHWVWQVIISFTFRFHCFGDTEGVCNCMVDFALKFFTPDSVLFFTC